MLIDQDWVSVGIGHHEIGWTGGGFVCFRLEAHSQCFEFLLDIADIRERIELFGVAVPTRIERQHVALEHSLKEADFGIAVLED